VNHSPGAVNPACPVLSASTTLLRDGRTLLLIHTEAGPGRFVFPAALGDKLFRVTNPAGGHVPPGKPRPEDLPRPDGRQSRLPPEVLAAYQRTQARQAAGETWRAAAKAEGVGAVAVQQWACAARRKLLLAAGRTPITKPSGAIL
jgi:hypothetical protein